MMPETPAPPAVLARIEAFIATHPTLVETCNTTAAECRQLAQDWYDLGDQRRGDAMQTLALAWEMAGESGDPAAVRP